MPLLTATSLRNGAMSSRPKPEVIDLTQSQSIISSSTLLNDDPKALLNNLYDPNTIQSSNGGNKKARKAAAKAMVEGHGSGGERRLARFKGACPKVSLDPSLKLAVLDDLFQQNILERVRLFSFCAVFNRV